MDELSPRVLEEAQNVLVDLVTREVVAALRTEDVRAILLKGPSFRTWLYGDGGSRPYADVDLLISGDDLPAARRVLDDLRFRPLFDSSMHFARGTDEVDLHCSIKGVGAPDRRLWEMLSAATEAMDVAGLSVEILSRPARALHVALHAAQHGSEWATPLEDLRRALALEPFETWAGAAGIAQTLGATEAFGVGLRLLPAGETISDRLGLERRASVGALLRATSPPPLALGIEALRGQRGLRAKLRFARRKLFPSRSYMEAVHPAAARSRFALALAYVRRLMWLTTHAGPAFMAWRRSRRAAR